MKETEAPPGPQLKHIDMSTAKFTANGTTYYIQSRLSLARYVEYLKLSNEISFNTDFEGMYSTLNKIFEAASHGNDLIEANHKARELAYNQINAIVDFTNREHPTVLRFCALFINAEEEDINKYDDRVIDHKVEDWTEEGLAIDDFFYLAANFIPSFRDTFRNHAQKQEGKKQPQKPKKTTSPITDSTTTSSKQHSEKDQS